MEELKQKTLDESEGCHQKDRTESESYGGAQTFMGIVDEKLVEVYVDTSNLLEYILNPNNLNNLNRAYRQVVRNKGVGGVDKKGKYRPCPVSLICKNAESANGYPGNGRIVVRVIGA